MNKTILIKGGQVLLNGKLEQTDLYIEGGIVAEIGEGLSNLADIIIDADGKVVAPAFVDMHTHLREPGLEYKEDIQSGASAAVKGGFGAVCCMPNTKPCIDNSAMCKYIRMRSREVNLCEVYPIGAISKGQKGAELAEMRLMSEAGAVAFSDDGYPVESSKLMRLALEYCGGNNLLITSHCEDRQLTDGGCVNEGFNATVAGLKGITRASEEVGTARELALAASLNVPVHIAHVSTKGVVDMIAAAKAMGVKVTAETAPHYFAATDDLILDYNTNSKINPPLREAEDVEAIINGLRDGVIDCIATDHAPHHLDDKNVEYQEAAFGTIGLETAFMLGLTKLVLNKKLTLEQLLELMSTRPAKILGLSDFGSIIEGGSANIVVLDTFVRGKYNVQTSASKARNCLFDGWELSGAVEATIVRGEIKWKI